MKKSFVALLFSLALVSTAATAQVGQPFRHKIALFVPLYLDSAFDASGISYRFDKEFPNFLNPGLEFYQGAQLALDSLSRVGAPLEVFVYDSRARRTSLQQQLARPELRDVEMIIGHATSSDVRILADAAQRKKVPFISATLPNDANVTNNPYYVVLNSTLRTHVEGIYRYLQRNHSSDNIVVFRRPGAQETQIRDYLQEIARSTTPALRMKFVDIGDYFNASQVLSQLDSTRRTVCIAGSLNEAFGNRLAEFVAGAAEYYPVTLVGMPTWDGLNFNKSEFRNLDIVYSSPFFYGRPSSLKEKITEEFTERVNGRPTDMFYRGYETMLRFALLLLDTKKDVASNLTRKGNYVFTQFDIQPVFLNKQDMTLDYFENKNLYFVKIINGTKTAQLPL